MLTYVERELAFLHLALLAGCWLRSVVPVGGAMPMWFGGTTSIDGVTVLVCLICAGLRMTAPLLLDVRPASAQHLSSYC